MHASSVPAFIERHFLGLAVILSAAALYEPEWFVWIKPYIPHGLGVIMFGMGLTLTFEDFRDIVRKWRTVGLGVLVQYTVMPILAFAVASVLGLPNEALVGMVVVGACPGGTASNVVALLARANVALSVTMTLAATCVAPLATPLLTWLILDARVDIDVAAMMQSVFWIVAFPLFDGLVLRHLLKKRLDPVIHWFPSVSIVTISLLIACIIGLNRDTLLAFPALVALAVALHNAGGLLAGYAAGLAAGCDKRDRRTLAIEVGMQNSGLGVALAVKYFGAASALPGALFSLWHNVTGILLARRWSR
ncbi:bile acid:sodium symporter family protein [Salidesulfovibrio brasiliensis]|uniref:bile acid:sodium symporter family protein n=1 Tax=Salidesulfovibrio brasiliensis TaxID=221711 RepID=UPI0006D18A95|nr:bile acid:sodium symporter family protein [Salidesulfovibrio brasiliensis]